jgi:hypothetical protein
LAGACATLALTATLALARLPVAALPVLRRGTAALLIRGQVADPLGMGGRVGRRVGLDDAQRELLVDGRVG